MKNAIKNVLDTLRNEGVTALPRTLVALARRVPHALAWRARKVRWALRRKMRGLLRRVKRRLKRSKSLRRVVGAVQTAPIANVTMTATAELAAAEGRLASITLPAPVEAATPELSVAIIVPTFKDTAFLAATLQSVAEQTYANWRCIVVDDASPEDVAAVVTRFAKSDARFVLARHGRNAGLAAARNTGLRLATEDLVLFLDADDLLPPASIEARVAAIAPRWDQPHVAGTYGQIVQCTESTTLADVRGWSAPVSLVRKQWATSNGECPFNVHAPLTRRSVLVALGGFDESFLNGAEDWDLWHRVLRHGYVFEPVQRIVGAYRQRTRSMVREHSAVHLNRSGELLALAVQPVRVDPAIAVADAAAPLGAVSIGHVRACRAAQRLGTDFTDDVDDPTIEFVAGGALASGIDDYVNAARAGIVRGLCLSPFVVSQLTDDGRDRMAALARRIGERIAALTTATRTAAAPAADAVDILRRTTVDVALVPDTVADVAVLLAVAAELGANGLTVGIVDTAVAKGDEGVTAAVAGGDLPVGSFNDVALGRFRSSLFLARREVGPVTLELFALAAAAGSRTAILDEPDRGLLVDESPKADAPTLDAAGIVAALAAPAPAPAAAPSGDAGLPSFTVLLPNEESRLDPEGTERMMALRDRYAGETAVIIGNGPSLNETDLSQLAHARSFGVNSIFLADDRLPGRLTFYTVEDTAVFKDNTEAVKAYQADHRFFPVQYKSSFEPHEITDNTVFFRMNGGFYGRGTGTECHPRFSTDATQRLFCGQSVTIINLQLAHWLGFQRVVLIGMDFSYTIPQDADRKGDIIVSRSDDPNHFHPGYFGAGKTWKDPKLDRVLINYRLAKEVYEATGREIVNATVGGKLEVFRRMALADAVR